MLTFKCDICKQEIVDDRKTITAGYGYERFQLCPACGWEIVDWLQDKKLVKLEIVKEKLGIT